MSHGVIVQLESCLTLGVGAFCLIKGGSAERWGAALIIADYVLADIAVILAHPHFPTLINFGLDFALAAGLLLVAIRFSNLWLGGAMLLQSIALCSYGMATTGDGLQVRSYVILNNMLSMLMLACILAGTVASWRRRVARRKAEGGLGAASPVLA